MTSAVSLWTACIKDLQDPAFVAKAVPDDSVKALLECFSRIQQQPLLPHAAWKKLVQDVQVTRKLVTLYVQALQEPNRPGPWVELVYNALNKWLQQANAAASPASRPAATVRQQLQDSQLLQHLGAEMDAAAAQLTAAVAALAAATADSSSSTGSSSTTAGSTPMQQVSTSVLLRQADSHSTLLLGTFLLATCLLSPPGRFSLQASLPAAPAAVRLVLSIFKAYSRLQQLDLQQELLPGVTELMHPDLELPSEGGRAIRAVPKAMKALTASLDASAGGVKGLLQSCPGARELLLLPEWLSCLAIMSVVTVLGLNINSDMPRAAGPVLSSSSAPGADSSTRSSTGRQWPGAGRQQRQQADSNSSGTGLGNGVRLDSLTPLSCSLFELLGVTKETMLQAAGIAKAEGRTSETHLHMYMVCYSRVLGYQVEQTPGGFSAQVLLQCETDLLLNLAVQQLAASIPDSHPGAHAAKTWICQLYCGSLHSLYGRKDLHKLPRPAVYTGPQVALQLLPSPFGPQQLPPLQLPEQQQQQQPGEWCVLAPTAPLLAELLPLLTRHCRTQQQWHLEQQQQPQSGALPREQLPSFVTSVTPNLVSLRALLLSSVVPDPLSTAVEAEVSPVQDAAAGAAAAAWAAAAAAVAPPAATGPTDKEDEWSFTICGMEDGMDALMLHAVDINSHFEAPLRLEAGLVDAATAAAIVAGSEAATAARVSFDLLSSLGLTFVRLAYPTGEHPNDQDCRSPSPLVMLASNAGPGSQIYNHLHSLLATMVKLSRWGIGKLHSAACVQYSVAAVCAASALLDAVEQQRGQLLEAAGAALLAGREANCSSGYAAAADALPSVVIVGRCCLQWGEMQMQAAANLTLTQEQQQACSPGQQIWGQDALQIDVGGLLSTVQEWLGAVSTCEQLAAAGYEPLPVLQQLEQLLATYAAIKANPPDTVAPLLAAAQQLQATGLALCSFAVPCMCNNPGCTSLAGLSELAAVSGRSCICAGCRVARYCGRACQRAAWKQHKPLCAALNAAAAAAAAAGSTAAGAAAFAGSTAPGAATAAAAGSTAAGAAAAAAGVN